jgi:hypothetical protein
MSCDMARFVHSGRFGLAGDTRRDRDFIFWDYTANSLLPYTPSKDALSRSSAGSKN